MNILNARNNKPDGVTKTANIWSKMTMGIFTSLIVGISISANAQSTIQFANLQDISTGAEIGGAGSLVRTADELWAKAMLSGLDKKAAYTLWWVIFNNPEYCATLPCSGADVGNQMIETSVFWAAGFVTGTDGTANVSSHINSAGASTGTEIRSGPQLVPGNGFDVEVHIVIRTHGKMIPGSVDLQTSQFNGACDVNFCGNQQVIFFLPSP